MRVTSWNLLHGMAIPPSKDLAGDQVKLGLGIQAIGADVLGIQEVDEKLARSGSISQTALVAEAMGSAHWCFAPVMVGEPGAKWRKLISIDLKLITKENMQLNRQSNIDGNYGMAATLDNGWTVINTHLSFVPGVNYWQLQKIKRWAKKLAEQYKTQVLIIGDMNLPLGLPAAGSRWKSLVTQNSYPSWGATVQFDYILSDTLKNTQYESLPTVKTGVSDHLPIRVDIQTQS